MIKKKTFMAIKISGYEYFSGKKYSSPATARLEIMTRKSSKKGFCDIERNNINCLLYE
jgi:hypothetical protein